jgi:hypothetical protein
LRLLTIITRNVAVADKVQIVRVRTKQGITPSTTAGESSEVRESKPIRCHDAMYVGTATLAKAIPANSRPLSMFRTIRLRCDRQNNKSTVATQNRARKLPSHTRTTVVMSTISFSIQQ